MEDLGYTWEIRQDFNQSRGRVGRVKLPGRAQKPERLSQGKGQRARGGWGPYSKFDLVLESWPSLCDQGHDL